MPPALQVVNGQATNPGTTVTTLTPNTGDSYLVRNATGGSNIRLLDAWTFTTTNLLMRVRSPLMHDIAQNDRLQPVASKAYPLMNRFANQELYPQDTIIAEVTGGTSEVDIGSLLIYYADLPGASARLHAWAEIAPLVAAVTTVEVDLTSSATSGNYSATQALNSAFDTLKANRDYAILGYECGTDGCSLGITGPDTSNLRVGGPLVAFPEITRHWFWDLSSITGLPLIPVINSSNRAGTLLDVVAQATSASFHVGVHLALLSTNLSS